MEDGQAAAEWVFYVPRVEVNNDGHRFSGTKVLFGGTILVDSHLESNSAYQAESVGVFTKTIFLHFLPLYLEQQQITTSLKWDNKGLVKCISRYSDTDMSHVTPDITEADIIIPTFHFYKQLEYNLEWHRGHVERRTDYRHQ